MERKLSSEEQERIRLLSDGKLYQEAIGFVEKTPPVEKSQMSGLLEYSRSWEDLEKFVKHQKDDRDWGEPDKSNRAHYQQFYDDLFASLNELREDAQSRYGFVFSKKLTKNEQKKQIDFFAGLLAREFIQHLVAEMMWQAWKQEEGKRR